MVGEITPDSTRDFVAWVNGRLYDNPVEKLKIFISSEGGDVESALTLYHFIRALPIETETVAFNKIGSAANLAFVAAQKRVALQGCIFVLHEGTNTIGQNTASLHQHEDTMLWIKDRVYRHVNILAYATGQDKTTIEAAMARTTFMNTHEAKVFGLVAEIIDKLPNQMA